MENKAEKSNCHKRSIQNSREWLEVVKSYPIIEILENSQRKGDMENIRHYGTPKK